MSGPPRSQEERGRPTLPSLRSADDDRWANILNRPVPPVETPQSSPWSQLSTGGSDPGSIPPSIRTSASHRTPVSVPGTPQPTARQQRTSPYSMDAGRPFSRGTLPSVAHLLTTDPAPIAPRPSSTSPRWQGTSSTWPWSPDPASAPPPPVGDRRPHPPPPPRPSSFGSASRPHPRLRAPSSMLEHSGVPTGHAPGSASFLPLMESAQGRQGSEGTRGAGGGGEERGREQPTSGLATNPDSWPYAAQPTGKIFTPDTLGPRIWMGTYFLPRYVGQGFIPGEGPVFYYDDGSHCKTIIDGDQVNPHWGVTKANKPRKRLAVACLTCREKKIKCDPDFPRCMQCEKLGHECRFQNAPRVSRTEGGMEHPTTLAPPAPPAAPSLLSSSSQPPSAPAGLPAMAMTAQPVPSGYWAEGGRRPETESHLSAMTNVTDPTPGPVFRPPRRTSEARRSSRDLSMDRREAEEHRAKRHRPDDGRGTMTAGIPTATAAPTAAAAAAAVSTAASSPSPTRSLRSRAREGSKSEGVSGTAPAGERYSSSLLETPSRFSGQRDPYDIDPELVTHLVEIYFDRVSAAGYRMLPRTPFLEWLRNARPKSPHDLMLVYCILMVASDFSTRADRKVCVRDFGRIARYAVDECRGTWTLQLVQSRFLVALQSFTSNKIRDAWDVYATTLSAAMGLRLHVEDEEEELDETDVVPYGLTRAGYAECRRSTFWAIYLLDHHLRLGSAFARARTVHVDDISLRLPCHDDALDEQAASDAPLFQTYLANPSALVETEGTSRVGSMARLVHLATIGDEVMAHAERSTLRPEPEDERDLMNFIIHTKSRLQQWQVVLPSTMVWSELNLERLAEQGKAGRFVTMHLLFETISMMLYRFVSWEVLSRNQVEELIQQCHEHARRLLDMTSVMASGGRHHSSTHFAVSYGIALAWDTVSARGVKSNISGLQGMVHGGLRILDDLRTMGPVRTGQKQMHERINELNRLWESHQQQRHHHGQQQQTTGMEEEPNDDELFELPLPTMIVSSPASVSSSSASSTPPKALDRARRNSLRRGDVIYGPPVDVYVHAVTGR
ncbi:MAG: hypothetical protein M1823_004023 [Watsoniomyces obsoletus]|nr:MAG: hypothetical protein M1823_004023 [Watsoniomyces obsoletus]